jgi:hypothetical protein
MSDFDGIDKSTGTSALAVPNGPLTREALEAAVRAIQEAAPAAACGSEESPHHYLGAAKVGERVRCAVCSERLIVMPNGRAMVEPKLADFFKRPLPLRFLDVRDPPVTDASLALRYAMATRPSRVFYGEMSVGYDWAGRPPKRLKGRNRTRTAKRTDFGARIEGAHSLSSLRRGSAGTE